MFTATVITKSKADGKTTFDLLQVKYRGVVIKEIFLDDQMKTAMADIENLIKSFEKGGNK